MTRINAEHHIEILFQSETVSAVIFHCPGKISHCEHPVEECSTEHQVVFPLDGLFMRYDAFGRFVVDSNHMLFFNQEQPHEITHPVWGSDKSLIINFREDVLLDLIGQWDRQVYDRAETPFTDAYALLDMQQQLLKQQLLMIFAQAEHRQKLQIEEYALELISTLMRSSYAEGADNDNITANQREAVFAAQCILNQSFRDTIYLNDIARQVYYSEYTLCRLFKQHLGTTIHQYLTSLRLAQALRDLAEQEQTPIGDIGVALGFSSPSHFSSRFLTTFGMTPTDFRDQATSAKIHAMDRNLKAAQMAS